jgi:AcrR family transcriptional regulator
MALTARARRPKSAIRVRQHVQRVAREAYREAILEAAERVFVRLGYRQAKMSDLAREVGVSTGTLYNYFDSKEAVFSSLVERARGEFLAALREAAGQPLPLERLRAMARAVLGFVERRGALVSVFTELGAVTESDIRRVCGPNAGEGYAEYLKLLSDSVRAAMRKKQIRSDVPVDLLVAALAGSLNGTVYGWMYGGREGALASRADAVLSLFLEGAAAR